MLTPVKTYGYCFCYTNGVQKELKGTLSYYKVSIDGIAHAVTHFDVLSLHNNAVVMRYGQMTPTQRRHTAQQKNKVRMSYLLTALQWLVQHNEEWQQRNINLNEIQQSLRNPMLIDNSETVHGHDDGTCSNGNTIKSIESFQVFFLDGTMSSLMHQRAQKPALDRKSEVQF
jgi:hypothetical protein